MNNILSELLYVKGHLRFSSQNSKDSAYLELAKDPEKNRGQLQKMMEDAAKEAGYTEVAYHGTNAGFRAFVNHWLSQLL